MNIKIINNSRNINFNNHKQKNTTILNDEDSNSN
jgi:hypothetical protein